MLKNGLPDIIGKKVVFEKMPTAGIFQVLEILRPDKYGDCKLKVNTVFGGTFAGSTQIRLSEVRLAVLPDDMNRIIAKEVAERILGKTNSIGEQLAKMVNEQHTEDAFRYLIGTVDIRKGRRP